MVAGILEPVDIIYTFSEIVRIKDAACIFVN